MNPWHDISESRISPEDFVAVIEISKGSKKKYELDKETGLIKLDRILFTSTHHHRHMSGIRPENRFYLALRQGSGSPQQFLEPFVPVVPAA